MNITHSVFWVSNATKEHPPPGTVITIDDVENPSSGWTPVNPAHLVISHLYICTLLFGVMSSSMCFTGTLQAISCNIGSKWWAWFDNLARTLLGKWFNVSVHGTDSGIISLFPWHCRLVLLDILSLVVLMRRCNSGPKPLGRRCNTSWREPIVLLKCSALSVLKFLY